MTNGSSRPDIVPAAEEEDWFGEGSAFESSEELVTALFALAETADPANGGQVAPAPRPEPPPAPVETLFEVFDPATGPRPAEPAVVAAPVPQTWSVRKAGVVLLPPKRPGRTGWTIRNSVQVLHRTEEVMAKLREQAVVTAFMSAAEVFRQTADQRVR